ncbi:MAG: hypothetical protein AB2805_08435 [Candidatus Thiodiazotropha sp.]
MSDASGSKRSKKPIPGFVKAGLVFSILFLFVVIAVAYHFIQDDNDPALSQTLDAPPDRIDAAAALDFAPNTVASIDRPTAASDDHPDVILPVANPSVDGLDHIRTAIDELRDLIANLSGESSQSDNLSFTKRLSSIEDDVEWISKVLDNLQQGFNELVVTVDTLGSRVNSHATLINKNKKGIAKAGKAHIAQHVLPSFSLLSIDRWGGQESAVLMLGKKISTAVVGDTRAGWTIKSFSRPGCIDVKRDIDNQLSTVCIVKGDS